MVKYEIDVRKVENLILAAKTIEACKYLIRIIDDKKVTNIEGIIELKNDILLQGNKFNSIENAKKAGKNISDEEDAKTRINRRILEIANELEWKFQALNAGLQKLSFSSDPKAEINFIRSLTFSDPISEVIVKVLNSYSKLNDEHENLSREHIRLSEEHNDLSSEHQHLSDEHGNLSEEHERLSNKYNELDSRHGNLNDKHKGLGVDHDGLSSKHENLSEKHKALSEKHEMLSEEHEKLSEKHEKLSEDHTKLSREKDTLIQKVDNLESQAKKFKYEMKGLSEEIKEARDKEAINFEAYREAKNAKEELKRKLDIVMNNENRQNLLSTIDKKEEEINRLKLDLRNDHQKIEEKEKEHSELLRKHNEIKQKYDEQILALEQEYSALQMEIGILHKIQNSLKDGLKAEEELEKEHKMELESKLNKKGELEKEINLNIDNEKKYELKVQLQALEKDIAILEALTDKDRKEILFTNKLLHDIDERLRNAIQENKAKKKILHSLGKLPVNLRNIKIGERIQRVFDNGFSSNRKKTEDNDKQTNGRRIWMLGVLILFFTACMISALVNINELNQTIKSMKDEKEQILAEAGKKEIDTIYVDSNFLALGTEAGKDVTPPTNPEPIRDLNPTPVFPYEEADTKVFLMSFCIPNGNLSEDGKYKVDEIFKEAEKILIETNSKALAYTSALGLDTCDKEKYSLAGAYDANYFVSGRVSKSAVKEILFIKITDVEKGPLSRSEIEFELNIKSSKELAKEVANVIMESIP